MTDITITVCQGRRRVSPSQAVYALPPLRPVHSPIPVYRQYWSDEVLWCSLSRRQHQIPADPVRIGSTDVLPVRSVRDHGVYIDADVTMRVHVTTVVQSCFAALRRLRSVRRILPRYALLTLVRTMKSRKAKLDEVSGDVGATWRAAQNLLHNNRKDVFSDDECAKLVSTFCKFFCRQGKPQS